MAATDFPAMDSPGLSIPASRVRYGVLGYLCALSFILYIDRVCISKAATPMMEELHLSKTEMGFVFGAFTVAYGLFEIPTGRWGDRFGSRGVLTRIVLWWSAFTALTGCVVTLDSGYSLWLPGLELTVPIMLSGFVLLVAVRFLFGAGEAGALPNSARVIARWFPPGGRGPAQGMITTSALVGGAVAPVIAAYLIKLAGWRLSFVIFGSLGVVWAAAFYWWFRDDPARHPGVNAAELRLISAAGRPAPLPHSHPPVPWDRVLTNPNVWLLGGISTCTSFVSYMYFSWYPTYLEKGRQVDNVLSGWLSSLVLAGGAVGCIVGGYLTDAVARRTGSRRWGRRLIGVTGLTTAAVLLAASVQCDVPEAAALLTAGASLSAFTTLPSWWAVVTEISGKHLGALFGLMNSMGVPGAVLSQIFFGVFADWRGTQGFTGRDQWDPGFYVCSGVLVVAAIGWLCIDPTRSAVEPRPPDDFEQKRER
jgi:sugar phosphate permease